MGIGRLRWLVGAFLAPVVWFTPIGGTAHLPRNGAAAAIVADKSVWQETDRGKALEPLLVAAVRPEIEAALTGRYGYNISFWKERVLQVQQHRSHPEVMRVIIEVQTYEGAHRPVGTDRLEFVLKPSAFGIEHAEHALQ